MSLNSFLGGVLPAPILFLPLLCLAASAIGFRRTVYFISIGYGFSIAAMSFLTLGLGWKSADPITWIQAALLAIYGLRLGIYLVKRESKASYRASQKGDSRENRTPLAAKFGIWIGVSLLYPLQFNPLLARAASRAAGIADGLPALSLIGVLVMAAGLGIEALADAQKAAAKKRAPDRFCGSGLYRVVRCPNYFGEILFWTGNLLAGAGLYGNWAMLTISVIGYACIFYVMIGSTRRLELKQEERYGSDPEYAAYARKVPVLFPLIPLYSLKKAKAFLS